MNNLRIIISCLVFCVCQIAALGNNTIDSLMRQLDNVISNREAYLSKKETYLKQLHDQYNAVSDDEQCFEALGRLYDNYHSFNTDSAYNQSVRQEVMAKRMSDPIYLLRAKMNRANILSATGMYHEALTLIDSIKFGNLPGYLHPYYFHIKRTIYGRLADYSAFPSEKAKYDRLTNAYRDSIMSVNPDNSLAYIITKADYFNVSGNPSAAVGILEKFMSENNLSEHERAFCAWTLAESYSKLGNKEKQKENLLISSISDLKAAVREYISLRELALLLYEEGDLDHAYEFMKIAVEDATKCNARQRIVELNNSYPKINEIYVEKVQKQKSELKITLVAISILLIIVGILLLFMRKQMIRINNSRKEIKEAYEKLNMLAKQLKISNNNLIKANNDIAEISELKEVYICQYMDQCVEYIERLDSYRKSLGKMLSSGKIKDLEKTLKSTTLIDEEFKAFYNQFDQTFLNLFPSFVDDFNALLQPEEAIIPKKGGLNTELRIFALIRLGITDSDKIAKFLRYSLTTIYNYRTKVRNKAKGDRNLLEQEVVNIGRH